MHRSHYELLKVQPDAPIAVIRAAYRALASQHHPDRLGGGTAAAAEAAHQEMARINAAYEVLMDPQRRARYDAELMTLLFAPLGPGAPRAAPGGPAHPSAPSPFPADEDADTGPVTRVDIDWADAEPPPPPRRWRREWLIPATGLVVAIAVSAWATVDHWRRAEAEQAVATRMRAPLPDAASGAAPAPMDDTPAEFLAQAGTPYPLDADGRAGASTGALAAAASNPHNTPITLMLPPAASFAASQAEGDNTLALAAAAAARASMTAQHHLLDGAPLQLRPDGVLPLLRHGLP